MEKSVHQRVLYAQFTISIHRHHKSEGGIDLILKNWYSTKSFNYHATVFNFQLHRLPPWRCYRRCPWCPTEFMSLDNILHKFGQDGVTDYVEFPDGQGKITDDTQMLLFTAEGLLRSLHRANIRGIGGAYLQIWQQSYLRWLYTQEDWHSEEALVGVPLDGWLIKEKLLFSRRAPGNTCLGALRSEVAGTMEEPINASNGCGGIWRSAPVSLIFRCPFYPSYAAAGRLRF